MDLSALLLFWGWGFHLLSALCFALAEAYLSLMQKLVLRPMGYRPELVPKKPFFKTESQKSDTTASQPARVSDIQQLHSSLAGLQHQVQKLQTSSCPSNQDNIQRWFHAATFDTQSAVSTHTTLTAARNLRTSTQPAACAAAAAAMALYSQADMPTDAAAAAVGAAALFAEQLSSSDPGSSCQSSSRRESSCCTVPPLEYDVSAEEQRELDDCAPAEFLCPLGRVLMTDPVCTPSGFTYQRSFIEDFLNKTGHDPARDTPLSVQHLYPNIVIRDQIATWLQKRGIAT